MAMPAAAPFMASSSPPPVRASRTQRLGVRFCAMPAPQQLSQRWFSGGPRQTLCFAVTAFVSGLQPHRPVDLSSHQPLRFSTALPNLSLNRTRYGMSRKASTRLGIHHRVPALRAIPTLTG